MVKRLFFALLLMVFSLGIFLYTAVEGYWGNSHPVGSVSVPDNVTQSTSKGNSGASDDAGSEILFGDVHVHTTYSADAYTMGIALLGGKGARPVADACDFARYCSALDFWSINDHAEQLTPSRWRQTVDSIRACNAVNDQLPTPGTTAFLGWEWSQMGTTPQNHYGHRNVILAGLDDDQIPTRPIGAAPPEGLKADYANLPTAVRLLNLVTARDQKALDVGRFYKEVEDAKKNKCADNVPVRELSAECMESVATPQQLFSKLDEWNLDAMVIPHGTTWGNYTPPASSWKKQLSSLGHDPKWQGLMEVYSGHGSAEQYRSWRSVVTDSEGQAVCPEPSEDYLPSCWRAGQIIQERCLAEGLDGPTCEERAVVTRQMFVNRGTAGHLIVKGATVEDWLNSGQCTDCFLPAFNYRPAGSLQYMLALSQFDENHKPSRFNFGVVAGSDNHTASPGTGYKEFNRHEMTEAKGLVKGWFNRTPKGEGAGPSVPDPVDVQTLNITQRAERDRISSFFTTGGLVGVHTDGRSREKIWSGMKNKHVYGTSGDRIMLWFNAEFGEERAMMGDQIAVEKSPTYTVKAQGAFIQLPGCPDLGVDEQRIEELCKNECYNPSPERKRIEKIEVVKITPQQFPGEEVEPLIHDPWLVHYCQPDAASCEFEFTDPEFTSGERDAVYYVRAIQAASEAINGANLRCEYNEAGECIKVNPCYSNEALTEYSDDCLSPVNERAWSSPIFVMYQEGGSKNNNNIGEEN